ncbi:MAG: hypothetical protein LBV16_01355 [Elusimicrobiota bacterium]|jgi:hypothetical protein|nr:hypothetical protein [Elusimicrobiota bacterium]
MYKVGLSIFAVIMLFSTVFAAEPSKSTAPVNAAAVSRETPIMPTKTAGSLNGHFWNSLTENQKVAFLTGFNDGLLSGTAGFATAIKSTYDNISNANQIASTFLDNFQLEATYNDAKDFLNAFYLEFKHRILPIKDAVQYFASLSKKQSTKEDIDKKSALDIDWYTRNTTVKGKEYAD